MSHMHSGCPRYNRPLSFDGACATTGVRECTVEEEEKKWRLNESVNTDLSLLEESPSGLWIQWKKE